MSGRRRALAILGAPALLLVLALAIYRRSESLPESPKRDGRPGERPAPAERLPDSPETPPPGTVPSPVSALTTALSAAAPRSLRVLDRSGNPLRAKVRVAWSRNQFKSFETMDLEADGEGKLSLNLDPRAWVALQVQAPGHLPAWRAPVTWGDLEERDLAFALPEGSRLEGSAQFNGRQIMANERLSFSPEWNPGTYEGQVASRLKLVDEEVTTDAQGRFHCSSLRPGVSYRVGFPDHPTWPALTFKADRLREGTLALKVPWEPPRPGK